MSVRTNSQPPSWQFALICGRRGLERKGVMLGFAVRRTAFAIERHRRIKERVSC